MRCNIKKELLNAEVKELVGAIEQEVNELANAVEAYEVDLSKTYAELSYAILISGVGTLPLGDIQAIKAKSKNGKTFLLSVFAAVALGAGFGKLQSNLPDDAKVIIFDTEQNNCNVANVARRIHAMLGWDLTANNERLKLYALRTMNLDGRLDFIKRKVAEIRPSVVFIDGIADLVYDFNDLRESKAIIEDLLKLSKENNCALCSVLHTNKSKEDSNMRGHLGTFLLQKSSDVFEVKKEGAAFRVEQTDARNKPVEGFDFVLDNDAIPQPFQMQRSAQPSAKDEAIKKRMWACFDNAETGMFTYNILRRKYEQLAGLSEGSGTSSAHIKRMCECGFLTVTNGLYSISSAGSAG